MSALNALRCGVAVLSLLAAAPHSIAAEADADPTSTATLSSAEIVVAYDTTTTGAISSSSRSAPSASVSASDVAQIRAAIAAFERGDVAGARALRGTLRDPGAVALLDWLGIRLASRQIGFAQIDAFYRGHRDWPMASWVRRRAEEALWLENVSPATVRGFFAANGRPERAEGKLALARALLASGNKEAAASISREAWR